MIQISRLSQVLFSCCRRVMRQTQPLCRDQQGFTLIETMIAVGLLAVISTISLVLMMGYIQGNENLNQALSRVQTLGQFRAVVADDLLHITRRASRDQTDFSAGQAQRIIFAGRSKQGRGIGLSADQRVLQFTRMNSLLGKVDPARSEIETVRYFIRDTQLIRRIYDRPDALGSTPFRDQILLRGVQQFDLKVYHQGQWSDEVMIYDTEADEQGVKRFLPTMVSVTIGVAGRTKTAIKTEHVFELGQGG